MKRDRATEDRAWENYWRENRGRGCVPDAPGIAAVLRECWADFARRLPEGASLLDLASGSGAVLRLISAERRDLELTGVDSVASLSGAGADERVLAGIAMEDLPFADHSFDSACSQFGFEYGDMERCAAELARVLRPKAPFRMVLHACEGPIVRQGHRRLDALEWAIGDSGVFGSADELTEIDRVTGAIAKAREMFPTEPVATDVLMALQSIIAEGDSSKARRASVRSLHERAKFEIATLKALIRAARSESEMRGLREILGNAELDAGAPRVLVEPQFGLAFAWLIGGARR